SACETLTTSRQLSETSRTPSLSSSVSQASPRPSVSVSRWSALAISVQLSSQAVVWPVRQVWSVVDPDASPSSRTPSLSSSGSQTSPSASPSLFAWLGLALFGQLSQASPLPSASVSVWLWLATDGQLSQTSPTPSASASAWLAFDDETQLSQT